MASEVAKKEKEGTIIFPSLMLYFNLILSRAITKASVPFATLIAYFDEK